MIILARDNDAVCGHPKHLKEVAARARNWRAQQSGELAPIRCRRVAAKLSINDNASGLAQHIRGASPPNRLVQLQARCCSLKKCEYSHEFGSEQSTL